MKQLSRAPRDLFLVTWGAVEPQHLQLSLALLSSSLSWCPALFLQPNVLSLQGGTQPMAQPLLQAMHGSVFPPACAGRVEAVNILITQGEELRTHMTALAAC